MSLFSCFKKQNVKDASEISMPASIKAIRVEKREQEIQTDVAALTGELIAAFATSPTSIPKEETPRKGLRVKDEPSFVDSEPSQAFTDITSMPPETDGLSEVGSPGSESPRRKVPRSPLSVQSGSSPRKGSRGAMSVFATHREAGHGFNSSRSLDCTQARSVCPAESSGRQSDRFLLPPFELAQPPEPEELTAAGQEALDKSLYDVFLDFARFGTRSETKYMDSFRFMKLCRECNITTYLKENQSVDLIFYQGNGSSTRVCAIIKKNSPQSKTLSRKTMRDRDSLRHSLLYSSAFEPETRINDCCVMHSKCKEIKSKKMSFKGFKTALNTIADLIDVDVTEVKQAIVNSYGPLVNNITVPCFIQLANDGKEEMNPQEGTPYGHDQSERTLLIPQDGTYPVSMVAAGFSSGFAPVLDARMGSPRGGC